jgi:carbamoyltransferase
MILGFSEGFHDAAIAVLDGPNIIHASHSERSSGVKHDRTISQWQKEYVSQLDIDRVSFYERPLLKKIRQLYAGQYNTVFSKRRLSFTPTEYHSHHLSHAAAAFQTSPFYESSVVVIDSIGEWDTISIWYAYYDNDMIAKYNKVNSIKYPRSVGLWYSALTKYVELAPLDEEYIFMGMATYGKPILELQEKLIKIFESNNLHRGISRGELFDHEYVDIAHNAQIVLEKLIGAIFSVAREHSDNICYGGGVALNCVANEKLYNQSNLWIMPNPGDAGAALGAAALAYGKRINWGSPYLGYDIDVKIDVNEVVEYLIQNKMCGIANGKAEFGPRALGNRSLIADPRDINIKDQMNKVKQRQMFRPFAPAILEEHTTKYFYGNMTKYMQSTAKCIYPDKFPGIVHVDGSSRVQVVSKDDPTILRKILECWYDRTGCPMLLNTSLNIKGKPMVDTVDDAIAFQSMYGIRVF